ncbi:hypothetical protein Y1Q_0016702 [Alligator mississippiensis]|uniref:Uncharacterized protein n=1 Tax=Alligator mississippiensis TaxID=8496 RepID=A0A151P665_ALLMI|nr:hypothetical protein Y1Q_0016702 [Alligator mississippiensis]
MEEEETLGQEATPHSPRSKQVKRSKRTQRRRRQVLIIGDSILRVLLPCSESWRKIKTGLGQSCCKWGFSQQGAILKSHLQ